MIVGQAARMDERPAFARFAHFALVGNEVAGAAVEVHADSIERYANRVHAIVMACVEVGLLARPIADHVGRVALVIGPL